MGAAISAATAVRVACMHTQPFACQSSPSPSLFPYRPKAPTCTALAICVTGTGRHLLAAERAAAADSAFNADLEAAGDFETAADLNSAERIGDTASTTARSAGGAAARSAELSKAMFIGPSWHNLALAPSSIRTLGRTGACYLKEVCLAMS